MEDGAETLIAQVEDGPCQNCGKNSRRWEVKSILASTNENLTLTSHFTIIQIKRGTFLSLNNCHCHRPKVFFQTGNL